MNLCIFGTSKSARMLYDDAIKYGTFNPVGFLRFEELGMGGGYSYKDEPESAPLPAHCFTINGAYAAIQKGVLDGVCIPENNYQQVRIAMINSLRANDIQNIYIALDDLENGIHLMPFSTREKYIHAEKDVFKIAIFISNPNSFNGIYLRGLIEENCGNVVVNCFFSDNISLAGKQLSGLEIVALEEILDLYRKHEIDGIVFNQKNKGLTNQNLIKYLRERKVNKIYMAKGKIFGKPVVRFEDIEELFQVYQSQYQVGFVNICTTDYCNLNCSGCNHFCSLLNERTKELFIQYDMETFKADTEALHRLLGDEINCLWLIGGEPFLHPLIGDFIQYARMLYPEMDLRIVTNGLLLPKLSQELLKIIRDNRILIWLTPYKPTKMIKDKIHNVLDSNGIFYYFVDNDNVNFYGKLNLNGDVDPGKSFDCCWDKYCHSLRNGKLAYCQYAFMIDKFNVYFNQSIPLSIKNSIDLRDKNLTRESVLQYLQTPSEICGYCDSMIANRGWHIVSGKADINDWLAEEKYE